MNTKQQYSVLLGIALLAGSIGGLLSNYFGTPPPVLAQQDPSAPRRITAEEFRVVDSQGRTRARLGLSRNGKVHLQLYDENETMRIQLRGTAAKPTVILTSDRDRADLNSTSLKFDSLQQEDR